MSNKSGFSKASESGAGSGLGEPQKTSENISSAANNSRYSLGGTTRLSLGAGKAGRLSQVNSNANNEFSDSGKLSLGGRPSMSANDSRNSLSRYKLF